MFSLFGRPKPCDIITTLRDNESSWYLSKIAKTTKTTYVYVTKLIAKLEQRGVVTTVLEGKKRTVRLTEKGMTIANSIQELKNNFEE
ncbi:Rrf2 family transcriptional regulator [Candidatus Micrarchaeota archaeon]|nr:Rrf2 family transcriptional regulator [Candidatus Micrarchaeota archaeon]MBU1166719.1 Rrf2 family transcriptional regulator [Candidatus Micrarchaeota archaeon]MBU1886642.1 Rrf2 family transcriptional regulator [Candidatus Micrarchaeota archaeon]